MSDIVQKILVCPLNWGLGHASRCVPVIRMFLDRGHEVHIGSDGIALDLLRVEFPNLPFVRLPGYNVQYKHKSFTKSMLLQLPSMLSAIVREGRVVSAYVAKHKIDCVVSDNRLGCLGRTSSNILMTHQLVLRLNNKFLSRCATWAYGWFIARFDKIWVPDLPPPNHLCGEMIESNRFKDVNYVGFLSRLKPYFGKKMQDVIVILSGPEPTRSRLEEIVVKQSWHSPYSMLIVRGLPHCTGPDLNVPDYVRCVDFLDASGMEKAIGESRIVIARSGYSTVMDLMTIGKSGILIPTPGQPEQELLGERLATMGRFIIKSEADFDLNKDVKQGMENGELRIENGELRMEN